MAGQLRLPQGGSTRVGNIGRLGHSSHANNAIQPGQAVKYHYITFKQDEQRKLSFIESSYGRQPAEFIAGPVSNPTSATEQVFTWSWLHIAAPRMSLGEKTLWW